MRREKEGINRKSEKNYAWVCSIGLEGSEKGEWKL